MGREIIQRIFPDKQEQAKAELELMRLDQEGEIQELATRMNAITKEAESEDPWTSRARPMFLYVFYVVILMLVLVAPFVGIFFPEQMEQFFTNVGRGFAAIPEELWWTFSAGYLGYAGLRTVEKRKK